MKNSLRSLAQSSYIISFILLKSLVIINHASSAEGAFLTKWGSFMLAPQLVAETDSLYVVKILNVVSPHVPYRAPGQVALDDSQSDVAEHP